MSTVNPTKNLQIPAIILPQLDSLTEATLESYLNFSNVVGEDLQSSNPISTEVMAQRLVVFLKANKGQINQEQVQLVSKVAQKAKLIDNNDKINDFEKLVKQINKLNVKLDRADLFIDSKLERNRSWKSIFTSHTAWKVGAVFATLVVIGIGYAMLPQDNSASLANKDIQSLVVGDWCAESYPVQCPCKATYMNGLQKDISLNGVEIKELIARLPAEKVINPFGNDYFSSQEYPKFS